jgi:hypothetical protein
MVMVMKWFRRTTPTGLEETPAYRPDPTLEAESRALTKIKSMCLVACDSAEIAGSAATTEGAESVKRDRLRFESAKRMSLELTKTITDEAYRDSALHSIVDLCMKANDIATARILVRAIKTSTIREKILDQHPVAFY